MHYISDYIEKCKIMFYIKLYLYKITEKLNYNLIKLLWLIYCRNIYENTPGIRKIFEGFIIEIEISIIKPSKIKNVRQGMLKIGASDQRGNSVLGRFFLAWIVVMFVL